MTTPASTVPASNMHGLRWAVIDAATLTRRGLTQWRRNPTQVIAGVAFVVMLVLLYALLFGGAMTVPGGGSYIDFLMPGMFVMTMAFGTGETMANVSADADRGITDRFRSMPIAASAVLVGRCLTDMLYSVVTLAAMVGVGLALGWRWTAEPHSVAAAFGLLLLLRFAVLWIGTFLGLLVRGPAAVNAVSTLLFPLTMVTSAFAPTESMPSWLGTLAEWNPLTATVYAARQLFGNPGGSNGSFVADNAITLALAWPILLVVVFAPLAASRYRGLAR
jgi:ABC-type polysaccharide/polyol phosphate export permease